MLAVAVAVGLLIGLSLGALGGGGSILTVPALVYLLGQSPHAATTGSLLVVGVTALTGMAAHWHAGRVRVVQGLTFGVLGVAGSYVGTWLSAEVDPEVLLAAFAGLMVVAAVAMLRRARGADAGPVSAAPRTEADAPSSGADPDVPPATARVAVLARPVATEAAGAPAPRRLDGRRALTVVAAATLVGLLTGFFGVGGGFVIVPVLVLVLGFEMPVAVGTSLLVIAVNSAAALAGRVGGDTHFDWPLLGLITASAVAGSFLGNRVAARVDPRRLTVAFGVLLLAVAAYTAVRSVPHLA